MILKSVFELKRKPLTTALLGVLAASGATHAQMLDNQPSVATAVVTAPQGGAVILYDQTDNPNGNGIPDQDFEAAYDAYDSVGADDFVVSDPTGWSVTQLNLTGTTGTPGGAVSNVTIYGDNAGSPDVGNVLCSYTGLSHTDTSGSLNIPLPTPCDLPGSTTYWVAHQADQNFGVNGQHFWSGRTTVAGASAHWANPGGGFGTPCATFMPAGLTCGVGGGTDYDLLFSLEGTVGLVVDADLSVTIGNNAPANLMIGSTFDYILTAQNAGPAGATGVMVNATLSSAVDYLSNDCGATQTGNSVAWTVGALGSGASATCNVTVSVNRNGALVTTASISGDQNDPVPGNDAGSNTLAGVPQSIPTLGWFGMGLMSLGLMLVAVRKRLF